MIKKVISGGQSGTAQAAIDAAKQWRIPNDSYHVRIDQNVQSGQIAVQGQFGTHSYAWRIRQKLQRFVKGEVGQMQHARQMVQPEKQGKGQMAGLLKKLGRSECDHRPDH